MDEGSGSITPQADSFEDLMRRASRLTPIPRAALPRLRVNSELCAGRFRILGRLGSGGAGVVHEAFDRERGTKVALKLLSRLDAAGIYRIKQEFRALADVSHPNLVRLHELFADDGLWLFSMDLVVGRPFDRFVRRDGVVDFERLRAATAQLAAGVSAIHAAGKSHRDLKPNNVLVTEAGHVVILDFGLVVDSVLDGSDPSTDESLLVVGTPAYMAPEQAAGRPASPSHDWYALGVMLFEALCGRLPFNGSPIEVMEQKQAEPAPRVTEFNSEVPDDLARLCAALLSRDPDARPDGQQLAQYFGLPAPSRPKISLPPSSFLEHELIGRDSELARLRDAYANMRRGKLTVLRITGESGIGKSTLVAAFLAELHARGDAVVLAGRCYEREWMPYKAFDSVVDQLSGHLRRLPEVECAALLPREVRALARVFPVLDRVRPIAAAPTRATTDEKALRHRAFGALAELLGRIRDRQPLVVHIDDLHWIDRDSTLLFSHLLAEVEPAPLLFILSQRPGAAGSAPEQAALAELEGSLQSRARHELRELVLPPLSADAATHLARSLLPSTPAGTAHAASIAAEADGNPFFVGELARHVTEACQRDEQPSVSLSRVLGQRLALLSDGARQLLELLSVSGRPLPSEVLFAAATAVDDPHRQLDLLCSAQLARASQARAYECYHDRIRVALAERIAPERQRACHARLARAWSERADVDPELLFEHSLAAGLDSEAGSYAVLAAAKANRNLAFERSAALLEQAQSLLSTADADRFALHERLAEALSLAGRHASAAAAFATAADRAGEFQRRTYLLHQSAQHFLSSGQSAEGMARLRQVFAAVGIAWPRTRFFALCGALSRLAWLLVSGVRYRLREIPLPMHFDGRGRTDQVFFPSDERAPPDQVIVTEMLLAGAGLLPPYDMERGLYFMLAFSVRALRYGDASRVAVALGMLSALLSVSRITRGVSRRLVGEATQLAREQQRPHANLSAATLNYIALALLFHDDWQAAYTAATEAEDLLQEVGRAHAFELWSARALQCFALLRAGRVREAGWRFELTAREAREAGDSLAAVGGDWSLRYLVQDDFQGALQLVEHKVSVLRSLPADSSLHNVVIAERICCALYAGRGPEALAACAELRTSSVAPIEFGLLEAHCALQAFDTDQATPAHHRCVRRAARRLRRRDGAAASASAAQLEAALQYARGEREVAARSLETARALYAQAGMALHEALMRLRLGQLRGGDEGRSTADEAERFIRGVGVANPLRWAKLLAPGLEPRPGLAPD